MAWRIVLIDPPYEGSGYYHCRISHPAGYSPAPNAEFEHRILGDSIPPDFYHFPYKKNEEGMAGESVWITAIKKDTSRPTRDLTLVAVSFPTGDLPKAHKKEKVQVADGSGGGPSQGLRLNPNVKIVRPKLKWTISGDPKVVRSILKKGHDR